MAHLENEAAAAVVIGRFEPLHHGHLALLRAALAAARRCIVVIGSAHQARTPKNPFTWEERRELVRLALPPQERERLLFIPMRDHYDGVRWAAAVRRKVDALLPGDEGEPAPKVVLVGHFKDATSDYLRSFPDWPLHKVATVPGPDGTTIRDAFFQAGAAGMEGALASLVNLAPESTLQFLRAFAVRSEYDRLVQEWRMLRHYHDQWSVAPYPPVFVTVDTLVRCAGHVLLVRRGQPPGVGLLATPGGFLELRETLYQSALRELHEETRLHLLEETMQRCLKAVTVFDHPDRSQRGRTITHVHYFDLGDRELPEVSAADDAQAAEWVPIEALPSLEDRFHDDHFHILDHFLGLTDD